MMMPCGCETAAIVIFFRGKKITAKLRFILLFNLRNPTCTALLLLQCFDWKKQYIVVYTTTVHTNFTTSLTHGILQRARYNGGV